MKTAMVISFWLSSTFALAFGIPYILSTGQWNIALLVGVILGGIALVLTVLFAKSWRANHEAR